MTGERSYVPAGVSPQGRKRAFFTVRGWSVRHSRFLEILYNAFAGILVGLDPLLSRVGYRRLEKPVVGAEKIIKSFLFDCRMCGQCVLSSTGMSCPMNCPKTLRNGPCGGVRADGTCEVEPTMICVWVEAWEGSQRMVSDTIRHVQKPVDRSLGGTSSWLRETTRVAAEKRAQKEAAGGAGP